MWEAEPYIAWLVYALTVPAYRLLRKKEKVWTFGRKVTLKRQKFKQETVEQNRRVEKDLVDPCKICGLSDPTRRSCTYGSIVGGQGHGRIKRQRVDTYHK